MCVSLINMSLRTFIHIVPSLPHSSPLLPNSPPSLSSHSLLFFVSYLGILMMVLVLYYLGMSSGAAVSLVLGLTGGISGDKSVIEL